MPDNPRQSRGWRTRGVPDLSQRGHCLLGTDLRRDVLDPALRQGREASLGHTSRGDIGPGNDGSVHCVVDLSDRGCEEQRVLCG